MSKSFAKAIVSRMDSEPTEQEKMHELYRATKRAAAYEMMEALDQHPRDADKFRRALSEYVEACIKYEKDYGDESY